MKDMKPMAKLSMLAHDGRELAKRDKSTIQSSIANVVAETLSDVVILFLNNINKTTISSAIEEALISLSTIKQIISPHALVLEEYYDYVERSYNTMLDIYRNIKTKINT